jgi:hypothetical protein
VKLIAFSGRKSSGKDTLCRFLRDNAEVLFGEDTEARTYSMAGPIKRLCIDVLGLTHEQCWGTDAQKNTKTRYRWEDLPHYQYVVQEHEARAKTLQQSWESPKGFMTARQVMQEVGTGIFRRMYGDVWAEAAVRAIGHDAHPRLLALINDVRFPNEVAAVQGVNGVVVRLTRAPYVDDEHESEKAMDGFTQYDFVLQNHLMDERASCVALLVALKKAGVVGRVETAGLAGADGEPLFAGARP